MSTKKFEHHAFYVKISLLKSSSALREAPSIQAHHELRENVVVPGRHASAVPRGLCTEQVAAAELCYVILRRAEGQ
jgi:hypothetical protein